MAQGLGDGAAAAYYKEQAGLISQALGQFWDGNRKVFLATMAGFHGCLNAINSWFDGVGTRSLRKYSKDLEIAVANLFACFDRYENGIIKARSRAQTRTSVGRLYDTDDLELDITNFNGFSNGVLGSKQAGFGCVAQDDNQLAGLSISKELAGRKFVLADRVISWGSGDN